VRKESKLTVSLATNEECSGLYGWCLRELNEVGEQVGPDLVPYRWGLELYATTFEAKVIFHSEPAFRLRGEKDRTEEVLAYKLTRVMFARLSHTSNEGGKKFPMPPIYMLGSSREVKDIQLYVQSADTAGRESCYVQGFPAHKPDPYSPRETEDSIQVTMTLERERFQDMFDRVMRGDVTEIIVNLNEVQGLYSEQDPGTDFDMALRRCIKVLSSSPSDHGLILDNKWKDIVKTTGNVGGASLSVRRRVVAHSALDTDGTLADGPCSNSEVADLRQDFRAAEKSVPINEYSGTHAPSGQDYVERALSRISKLLGLLVIFEILRFWL
jgi:hypothetical protein